MQAAWFYLFGGILLLINVVLLRWLLRRRQVPITLTLRLMFWFQGGTGGALILAGVMSLL